MIARTLLAIFMCCIPLEIPAGAATVDNGDFTTDTISGLDWLDLTLTTNRSYNNVASQLGDGGDFDGWRYASVVEVEQLWTNAGIAYESNYTFFPEGDPNVLPLMQKLGITKDFNPAGGSRTQGFTSTVHPASPDRFGRVVHWTPWMNYWSDNEQTVSSNSGYDVETAFPEIGSWLVRDAVPVPTPAAVWLIMPALTLVIIFKCRARLTG